MRYRSTLGMIVVAATLLGACHKQSETRPENREIESPKPPPQEPMPVAKTPTETVPKSAKSTSKASPKPTVDEQMLDDADATGMTSHTETDANATGSGGNDQL